MGPHFRELFRSPRTPVWETSGLTREHAIQEFMQITDVEKAKKEIEKVVKQRLLNTAGDRRIPWLEQKKRMRYLSNALDFAEMKHSGQERISKEPYVLHPYNVAYMIAIDPDIQAADLPAAVAVAANHDVLEDTRTSIQELKSFIGEEPTSYIIPLSYKIKIFNEIPFMLDSELARIGDNPKTKDEEMLVRWATIDHGPDMDEARRELMVQAHSEWLKELPPFVAKVKAYDNTHNFETLPELGVPGRHPSLEAKITRMWDRKLREAPKHILPAAAGVAAGMLLKSIQNARERRKTR